MSYYRQYQFSQVYQTINRFCSVELSSLYIDVLKDRLYCNAPKRSDTSRRTDGHERNIPWPCSRLLAPIIPFTAEEAWQSVGEQEFYPHNILSGLQEIYGQSRYRRHLTFNRVENGSCLLRSRVNEKLEEARREKKIGKSLEAYVEINNSAILKTSADRRCPARRTLHRLQSRHQANRRRRNHHRHARGRPRHEEMRPLLEILGPRRQPRRIIPNYATAAPKLSSTGSRSR